MVHLFMWNAMPILYMWGILLQIIWMTMKIYVASELFLWKVQHAVTYLRSLFICREIAFVHVLFMMTSSNGNIFRVTAHLCGEFTGPRWIPRTKASDAELWCLNKRLSKQSWAWWLETLSRPLWRHRNGGNLCTLSLWCKYTKKQYYHMEVACY